MASLDDDYIATDFCTLIDVNRGRLSESDLVSSDAIFSVITKTNNFFESIETNL